MRAERMTTTAPLPPPLIDEIEEKSCNHYPCAKVFSFFYFLNKHRKHCVVFLPRKQGRVYTSMLG